MSQPPPGDLLDLPATRGRAHALAAAGILSPPQLDHALHELDHRPTPASWSAYLYWHALILGIVLLVAGAIFFVAANWSALSGFTRMGIVGGAMVAATLVGGYLGDTLPGRASTLLGGLLFGPLIAVYGQVYQTGADAWELFAWWSAVLIAYGLLARFVGTWIMALLCLHIAGFTWIDQELGSDFYEGTGSWIIIGLALLDAGLVALGERFSEGRERELFVHTAAFLGLALLVPFGILMLVDLSDEALPGSIVLLAALAAIWLIYRRRRPDLGMLAAFAGVVTLLVSTLAGRILLDDLDTELFGVALLGLIVCAQVWAFTRWLLAWRREQEARR